MPFLLEDALKKNGGIYEKASKEWEAKVVADGLIITGQNPSSSSGLADAVISALEKK